MALHRYLPRPLVVLLYAMLTVFTSRAIAHRNLIPGPQAAVLENKRSLDDAPDKILNTRVIANLDPRGRVICNDQVPNWIFTFPESRSRQYKNAQQLCASAVWGGLADANLGATCQYNLPEPKVVFDWRAGNALLQMDYHLQLFCSENCRCVDGRKPNRPKIPSILTDHLIRIGHSIGRFCRPPSHYGDKTCFSSTDVSSAFDDTPFEYQSCLAQGRCSVFNCGHSRRSRCN